MTRDLVATRHDVLAALKARRIEAAPDALDPLRRIDFKQLVRIHDHEEAFLFDVFVSSLVQAHKTRVKVDKGTKKITAHDVRTAMLMLGTAVEHAPEQTISRQNKSTIKDVCPYCKRSDRL
jgi:hypothetical protein